MTLPPAPSQETPRRDGRSRRRRAALGAVLGLAAGLALLGAVLYTLALLPELPRLREVRNPEIELATVVLSADGQEVARFFRENRTWISYEHLSPHVVHALVATEDHRFYGHWGIDVVRLVSSLFKTAGGDRQGGSTLTMQLARNLYREQVGNAPSLERKVKEMITAVKLERHYSKEEILEMYLNTVPFGYNAFGIEAAAETYFGKSAATLDLAESATLVGMLKGTTRYNPVRNPELALQRRNVVLGQLVRRDLLAPEQFERLRREGLGLRFQTRSLASSIAPHFAEHVRTWLEDWAERSGRDLYADGLRVYTTLDARLQHLANEAVDEQMRGLQAVVDYEWSRASGFYLGEEPSVYERHREAGRVRPFAYFWERHPELVAGYIRATARHRSAVRGGADPAEALARLRADGAFMDSLRTAETRLETGFVALDPHTGHVKAWVGGRDFLRDQYDKVALARRQPGSTFKPFVYTAAIDFGYSPYHTIRDSLVRYGTGARTWTPRNAGGGYSGRAVTLRDGLAYSKNTVTAQLTAEIGPFRVAEYAERLGVRSPLDPVPSLGLGTSEVTLLEMVSAYGTLAGRGIYREPVFVTRIEDRRGRVLATFEPASRKALSMYTAYTVVDMMRDVIRRGTGARLRSRFGIEADVAGKTGTTQNSADGWFIMMHPRLVAGAWVGFNDRRITFRSDFWGQGGHNALYVVGDFLRRVQQDARTRLPDERFTPPPGYREPRPPEPLPDERRYRAGLTPDPSLGASPRPDAAAAPEADPLTRRDGDVERTLRQHAGRPTPPAETVHEVAPLAPALDAPPPVPAGPVEKKISPAPQPASAPAAAPGTAPSTAPADTARTGRRP